MNHDDDQPPSPEELEAAARLAAALERDPAAELIRAGSGRAAPLGEPRARALARAALAPRRRRRRLWMVALPLMAVAILLLLVANSEQPLPERLQARSAGLLVPGPFPTQQTAAERLDLVTADRLIALREARCRRGAR